MAELAARHTGAQAEVADGDSVILERIGKVILPLCHGSDKHADALLGTQRLDIVVYAHDGGVKAKRDLAAVRREVVCDGVLDDLQQLLLRVGRADRELMQQLHHQTGEALEGSGDTYGGADFDQDPLGGVDVYLQLAGLVDGRIEESEKALFIRSSEGGFE